MKLFQLTSLMIAALLMSACGYNAGIEQEISGILDEANEEHHEGDGHDHGGHVHVAPNGGSLVEIGDHFANVEIVLDSETGMLTLYSLGAHADKPVRLVEESLTLEVELEGREEPLTLVLDAIENPLSGETIGDTSQFATRHEDLIGVDHFHATLARIQTQGVVFQAIEFAFPHEDH